MATLMNTLQLTDGNLPAIRKMDQSIDVMAGKFQAVQKITQNFVNVEVIQSARQEINMLEEATQESCGYMEKLKKTMGDLKVGEGVQKVMNLSDKMVQTTAKLNMANDGQQSTAELQDMIYQSANRSGTSYEANAGAVASLAEGPGDTFSDNGETIAFVEAFNKSMALAGASQEQMDSTRTELVQALGSGALGGDDFSSIFANVPQAVQMIADYMDVPIEQMNTLADQGAITGDVVKGALLSSMTDIDTEFEAMPMTFEQATNLIKNKALKAFEPIFQQISSFIQTDSFQQIINGIIVGLMMIVSVASTLFGMLQAGAAFVIDNWSWFQYIVLGLVLAFVAYNTHALVTNALMGIQAAKAGILAGAQMLQTGSTLAAKTAQDGLNLSLYACPITWIILAIIALVLIIYLVVAAINYFAGTAISATGIIAGTFMWLFALIGNIAIGFINSTIQFFMTYFVEPFVRIIEFILNVFNGGFDSFGDGVANLIGQIISWFLSLGKVVTTIIDAIFGTDWTDGLNSLQKEVGSWGKNDNAITLETRDYKIDHRFDMTDAYGKGYDAGENFEQNFDMGKFTDGMFGDKNPYENEDPYNNENPFTNSQDDIYETSNNTARMADTMDVAEEDLTYLRDLAEQDVINRFTTAEIKVDMGGITNQVNGEQDLDGMVEYLENTLYETMAVASEGVHE